MIVGGLTGSSVSIDAEIYRLIPSEQACQKPADNPFHDYGTVGGFVNGRPLICGGMEKALCSEYSFNSSQWALTPYTMNEDRWFAASVILSNGTFLVLGGRQCPAGGAQCTSQYVTLENTEILMDGSHFEYGINQPKPLSYQCVVIINDNRMLVAGGFGPAGEYYNSSYILELGTNSWTRIGDMNRKRFAHSCGLVGGDKVVAAGGGDQHDSTEILDLGTMTWGTGECGILLKKCLMGCTQNFIITLGPNLPQILTFGPSISYENSILIFGGTPPH